MLLKKLRMLRAVRTQGESVVNAVLLVRWWCREF